MDIAKQKCPELWEFPSQLRVELQQAGCRALPCPALYSTPQPEGRGSAPPALRQGTAVSCPFDHSCPRHKSRNCLDPPQPLRRATCPIHVGSCAAHLSQPQLPPAEGQDSEQLIHQSRWSTALPAAVKLHKELQRSSAASGKYCTDLFSLWLFTRTHQTLYTFQQSVSHEG